MTARPSPAGFPPFGQAVAGVASSWLGQTAPKRRVRRSRKRTASMAPDGWSAPARRTRRSCSAMRRSSAMRIFVSSYIVSGWYIARFLTGVDALVGTGASSPRGRRRPSGRGPVLEAGLPQTRRGGATGCLMPASSGWLMPASSAGLCRGDPGPVERLAVVRPGGVARPHPDLVRRDEALVVHRELARERPRPVAVRELVEAGVRLVRLDHDELGELDPR